MSVTPKNRQRIIELVEIERANKLTPEETLRAVHQEMPHITAAELEEVCRGRREEFRLDAAVASAEEEALGFIADTLEALGQDNFRGAVEELTLRSEQGDQQAAELLEYLHQAYVLAGGWIQATGDEIERRKRGETNG